MQKLDAECFTVPQHTTIMGITMDNKVKGLIGSLGRGRGSLIPLLQRVQSEFGYLPREAVASISDALVVSESDVYGVATFYSEFKLKKPGEHNFKVCMGTSCYVIGGGTLLSQIIRLLGVRPGETTPDGKYSLDAVACLGCCSRSPTVVLDDVIYGNVTPFMLESMISKLEKGSEAV
jgi:NADH-quinone oxidoreductase subunit E